MRYWSNNSADDCARRRLRAASSAVRCWLRPRAQVSSYGDKQTGENTGDQLPQVLQRVGVTQRLNQMLPLDAQFVDDTGKTVRLGDYFGKRPAILSLVYYNCPMLCSEEMDGLASALEMVHLTPGKDFEIVIISIDPSETPQIAAKKKAFYVKRYGRPETAERMALPHRATGGDRRGLQCDRLWLRPRARAGRQAGPVRPRQRDRGGHDRRPPGAVLPGRGVLAQGHSAGPDRGLGQQASARRSPTF